MGPEVGYSRWLRVFALSAAVAAPGCSTMPQWRDALSFSRQPAADTPRAEAPGPSVDEGRVAAPDEVLAKFRTPTAPRASLLGSRASSCGSGFG